MMSEMACADERERADGEWIVAGDAATHPCGSGHVGEERIGGEADATKIFDVRGPGIIVGMGAGNADVLVVAGQRRVEAAREPQSSKCEGAFGVRNVAQDLADRPFVRSVPVKRFFFGDGGEKCERFGELTVERRHNVIARDLVDVSEVIRGSFGGFRASEHRENLARAGPLGGDPACGGEHFKLARPKCRQPGHGSAVPYGAD